MGQIINFENPQLLVDAQWYPPPQGDPQDIRSFAREQAYICCIGKTHAVFRFIFIRELPAALYDEDKVIRRSIKAIGVDILLEHNSSKSALGKIEATRSGDSASPNWLMPSRTCSINCAIPRLSLIFCRNIIFTCDSRSSNPKKNSLQTWCAKRRPPSPRTTTTMGTTTTGMFRRQI